MTVSSYFSENIEPERIIRFLETEVRERIIPGDTLIIFDEVQSCERALTSLKYFNEKTPELDFVMQKGNDIIPIEVKTGIRTKSKSLNMFAEKYKPRYSIRISSKNFGFENNIKSVPLYAAFCL